MKMSNAYFLSQNFLTQSLLYSWKAVAFCCHSNSFITFPLSELWEHVSLTLVREQFFIYLFFFLFLLFKGLQIVIHMFRLVPHGRYYGERKREKNSGHEVLIYPPKAVPLLTSKVPSLASVIPDFSPVPQRHSLGWGIEVYVAIHRTKEKTQSEREASWGLERGEFGE